MSLVQICGFYLEIYGSLSTTLGLYISPTWKSMCCPNWPWSRYLRVFLYKLFPDIWVLLLLAYISVLHRNLGLSPLSSVQTFESHLVVYRSFSTAPGRDVRCPPLDLYLSICSLCPLHYNTDQSGLLRKIDLAQNINVDYQYIKALGN